MTLILALMSKIKFLEKLVLEADKQPFSGKLYLKKAGDLPYLLTNLRHVQRAREIGKTGNLETLIWLKRN